VLTAGALAVLIADVLLPRSAAARCLGSLLALGATVAALVPFRHTQVEVAHGLLAVDQFALFFKVVFFAAGITVLMSVRYLEIEGRRPASITS
jgi:NADH:ubiquinone oxidoreductase subunit 2 (subunit N)